ncbi:MAG: ion channel, partial [Bryobacteraceae bacterium]
SWTRFLLLTLAAYVTINALFAVGYLACGPGALEGGEGFSDAFFFSVQTAATIGYGRITPRGLAANLLVTLEGLTGILVFALATGLVYGRFSRPTARIIFSQRAVVAPHRGRTALMLRLANQGINQITDVEATVVLARWETAAGKPVRRFYPLELDRPRVTFLPLHWVVVHTITDSSPLAGVTEAEFGASDPELLILVTALDDTFSQTVHARTSYKHDEFAWGARFADVFESGGDVLSIDLGRLHEIEPA